MIVRTGAADGAGLARNLADMAPELTGKGASGKVDRWCVSGSARTIAKVF
jgi:hypothetical protein